MRNTRKLTRKHAVLLPALLLMACSSNAAITPGTIVLSAACPVDPAGPAPTGDEAAPLVTALLSPLIGYAVNSGLKAAGAKLQEISQEAQVDVLQRGDHFYRFQNGRWGVNHHCLIIASKETKTTGDSLREWLEGYEHVDYLVERLENSGFEEDHKPGFLALLELELSAQRTEYRFIPRYARMSHSIREKRVDKHARDITLELSYRIPGQENTLDSLIKFEGVRLDEDIPLVGVAAHWMTVPGLNASEVQKLATHKASRERIRTFQLAADLAGAAANNLGASEWKPPSRDNVWDPVEMDGSKFRCPSEAVASSTWQMAYAWHAEEAAKPNDRQDAKVLAMLSHVLGYAENCVKVRREKGVESANASANGNLARSYDLSVTIKEFRDRPVARFFGNALSDETTRSALAKTLIGELDPAARAAAKLETEKATGELLAAYEQAKFDAEIAILAYNNAELASKSEKLLTMEFKKRTANRAAIAAGVSQPYPEAGTWVN